MTTVHSSVIMAIVEIASIWIGSFGEQWSVEAIFIASNFGFSYVKANCLTSYLLKGLSCYLVRINAAQCSCCFLFNMDNVIEVQGFVIIKRAIN